MTATGENAKEPTWIAELDQQKLSIAGKIAAGKSTFLRDVKKTLARYDIECIVEEEKVDGVLLEAYIDSTLRVQKARNANAAALMKEKQHPNDPQSERESIESQIALNAARRTLEVLSSNFQTERAGACHHRQEIVMVKRQAFENRHVAFVERELYENLVFAKANERCGNFKAAYIEDFYKPMLDVKNNYPCDLIIYLHVTDNRSVENQATRDRKGEDNYRSEYLSVLGDEYFDYVLEHVERGKMLVVDWNKFGKVELVLAQAADVLSGRRKLPRVTRIDTSSDDELSSSAGITRITGDEGEVTVCSKPSTKRKGYHDTIIKALANFQDVEIYI